MIIICIILTRRLYLKPPNHNMHKLNITNNNDNNNNNKNLPGECSRLKPLPHFLLLDLRKFTGKHLCQSLFFNKVAGLRPATLLKKRLGHRCFQNSNLRKPTF